MTGTEQSSVLGGRQEEKARSKPVAVERSMPVQQTLGMIDHQEPAELTSRRIGGVDVCHG